MLLNRWSISDSEFIKYHRRVWYDCKKGLRFDQWKDLSGKIENFMSNFKYQVSLFVEYRGFSHRCISRSSVHHYIQVIKFHRYRKMCQRPMLKLHHGKSSFFNTLDVWIVNPSTHAMDKGNPNYIVKPIYKGRQICWRVKYFLHWRQEFNLDGSYVWAYYWDALRREIWEF